MTLMEAYSEYMEVRRYIAFDHTVTCGTKKENHPA
jgi:hypothetical protein